MSIVRQATVTLLKGAEALTREALKRLVRKGSGFVVVEAEAPGNYVAFTLSGGSVCFFNTPGFEGAVSVEDGARIAIDISVKKATSMGVYVGSVVVRESNRLHPADDVFETDGRAPGDAATAEMDAVADDEDG